MNYPAITFFGVHTSGTGSKHLFINRLNGLLDETFGRRLVVENTGFVSPHLMHEAERRQTNAFLRYDTRKSKDGSMSAVLSEEINTAEATKLPKMERKYPHAIWWGGNDYLLVDPKKQEMTTVRNGETYKGAAKFNSSLQIWQSHGNGEVENSSKKFVGQFKEHKMVGVFRVLDKSTGHWAEMRMKE